MSDAIIGVDGRALHAMQRGPLAYHCPTGHGPMNVWSDMNSPSGLSLACNSCGHRIVADTALIGTAIARSTTTEVELDLAPAVQLPDGTAPRGLRQDGTVRTTGWVQIWRFPVSSGLWAVLASFFLTLPTTPWVTFMAMPVGFVLWKLCTAKWIPASRAVNTGRTPVTQLTVGQLIRLYGTAGPVGQVSALGADAQGRILLRIVGGTELLRPREDRVWRVALRN